MHWFFYCIFFFLKIKRMVINAKGTIHLRIFITALLRKIIAARSTIPPNTPTIVAISDKRVIQGRILLIQLTIGKVPLGGLYRAMELQGVVEPDADRRGNNPTFILRTDFVIGDQTSPLAGYQNAKVNSSIDDGIHEDRLTLTSFDSIKRRPPL